MTPAQRAAILTEVKGGNKIAAIQLYREQVKPGSGLAPDARLDAEGFKAMLAIRAEMEGMWGGTPPAPGKYLDLTHFDKALQE